MDFIRRELDVKRIRLKPISSRRLSRVHRKQKLNYHILYLIILTKKIFNYIIFPLKRESLFISHLDFSLKQLRARLGEREIGSRVHFHVGRECCNLSFNKEWNVTLTYARTAFALFSFNKSVFWGWFYEFRRVMNLFARNRNELISCFSFDASCKLKDFFESSIYIYIVSRQYFSNNSARDIKRLFKLNTSPLITT